VLCGIAALEASPMRRDLQAPSIALIPGPTPTNSSVIGHTASSDITARDTSFRTELTLVPIDAGRGLPAMVLSFHLHPSVDAP
jgi:hypothetical protein